MTTIYKHNEVRGATVYKLQQSNNYYISYYDHNNKRVQQSAKTDSLEKAINKLNEKLIATKLISSGEYKITSAKRTPTVKEICEHLITEINNIKNYKNLDGTNRLLHYIMDDIGHIYIDELSRSDLLTLENRATSLTVSRNINKCIKIINEYAVDKKIINYIIPCPKFHPPRSERRESISLNKHLKIANKISDGFNFLTNKKNSENMFLLSQFIKILRRTGLRVGEASSIRFCDVYSDGLEKIFLKVKKSKTRTRKILIDGDTTSYILEIRSIYLQQYNHYKDDNAFVFARTDGIIPNFTDRLKDFKNRNKDFFYELDALDYVLYTERHSFICNKIAENKRIDDISEHCGTSTKMIEDFYRDELATRNIQTIYNKKTYNENNSFSLNMLSEEPELIELDMINLDNTIVI